MHIIITSQLTIYQNLAVMKRKMNFPLLLVCITLFCIPFAISSCNDEDEVKTNATISTSSTPVLAVGESATATINIVAEGIKSFKYYKVVDEVRAVEYDAINNLVKEGNKYTYSFSYTVQEFDDLHTLGFEFEIVDKANVSYVLGLVVNTELSLKSSFVKFDWKVTASEWLGMDVLAPHDAAYIYRFHEDGTYEVDMTPEYADNLHHFCYWVFKETPDNGDTLAVIRLVRKLRSGETAVDEYYDYRIVNATQAEMTMYWDIPVFGMFNIANTFTSQPKGAFQPYGTPEMASEVGNDPVMSCSTVDPALLTIQK